MLNSKLDTLKVGGYRGIPMSTATGWVSRYTDAVANASLQRSYAFPAYDQYRGGDNVPQVLDDADFLAPALLNVTISIRSFYALQQQRSRLQELLAAEELARPLASLTDEQIQSHIGGLFAILDEGESVEGEDGEATSGTLPGIGGTKLSKVLHRKRPESIPLHDRWVWSCYVGDVGDPVPRAKGRSWREYMTLVAQEMAADIRAQPEQFKMLQRASHASPALTDLRMLDIVAWNVGRESRSALGE